MVQATNKGEAIDIQPVERTVLDVAVIGLTPLICNKPAIERMKDLLLPRGSMNAAEKAAKLKHDPLAEYRASPHLLPDGAPTLIGAVSGAFKEAIMTAALDVPGAKKTETGRRTSVKGKYTPIYGVPELFMATVRTADVRRTLDVRTRAIIPRWAAIVQLSFVRPIVNERAIINLLSAAGLVAGIGDGRPELGGDHGQFALVDPDDERFRAIVERGGRDAQQAALDNPAFYDRDTEELFSWFYEEATRRGKIEAVAA